MKKLLSAALALALCLSLSPAVLAAEDVAFTDVGQGDWFAPYVAICVQEGLMVGVGEGRFAPERELTGYECAMLALRLADLSRGGDGLFDPAPAQWGWATLHFPGDRVIQGYLGDERVWTWRVLGQDDPGHLGIILTTDQDWTWAKTVAGQAATLTVDGENYVRTLILDEETGFLYLDRPAGQFDEAIQAARNVSAPGAWWRDGWYYAQEQGLTDLLMTWTSLRRDFAYRLAAVTNLPGAAHLTAINVIDALPDAAEPYVLELYRAGVLTGNDPYGTFDGSNRLTRAEAAAICARILRPDLRVKFEPRPLESYESYTLTYLHNDVDGGQRPDQTLELLSLGDEGLLRLDGAQLSLPKGYTVQHLVSGLAGLAHRDGIHYAILDSRGLLLDATAEEVEALSLLPDESELHPNYQRYLNNAYYNAALQQVTPAFTWCGEINSQGTGFVGKDGKIYRIEFVRVKQNKGGDTQ